MLNENSYNNEWNLFFEGGRKKFIGVENGINKSKRRKIRKRKTSK